MKNKCKHKNAQRMTSPGTLFPYNSADWYWCPDCGASKLVSLRIDNKGKSSVSKEYPWRSPKNILKKGKKQ